VAGRAKNKEALKKRISQIIHENPDKSLSDLFNEYEEFSEIVDDEGLSKFTVETYNSLQEKLNNEAQNKKQQTKQSKSADKPKETTQQTQNQDELIQLIREQQKLILDQQKKIQDHEQKLNDIINIFQTVLSNPNALMEMLGGQMPTQQAQQTQEQPSEKENVQPQQNNAQQPTMQQRQQAMNQLSKATGGNPLDFNKLQDVLKSIAIITSNLGQRQQASPMDIIGNITNSVDIATTIASSIGEGLGKLFDTFNKMQDRAFKSWALKSKGVAEEDIEKLLEQKLEEKLNALINRSGGN